MKLICFTDEETKIDKKLNNWLNTHGLKPGFECRQFSSKACVLNYWLHLNREKSPASLVFSLSADSASNKVV